MNNKSLLTIAIFLAVLCNVAFAKDKGIAVEINDVQKFAQGSIGEARYGGGKEEDIGCGVSMSDTGLLWAFCNATAANGDYVICTTDSESFVDAIAMINSTSYIRFFWNEDAAGPFGLNSCATINVSNQSQYLWK